MMVRWIGDSLENEWWLWSCTLREECPNYLLPTVVEEENNKTKRSLFCWFKTSKITLDGGLDDLYRLMVKLNKTMSKLFEWMIILRLYDWISLRIKDRINVKARIKIKTATTPISWRDIQLRKDFVSTSSLEGLV